MFIDTLGKFISKANIKTLNLKFITGSYINLNKDNFIKSLVKSVEQSQNIEIITF